MNDITEELDLVEAPKERKERKPRVEMKVIVRKAISENTFQPGYRFALALIDMDRGLVVDKLTDFSEIRIIEKLMDGLVFEDLKKQIDSEDIFISEMSLMDLYNTYHDMNLMESASRILNSKSKR